MNIGDNLSKTFSFKRKRKLDSNSTSTTADFTNDETPSRKKRSNNTILSKKHPLGIIPWGNYYYLSTQKDFKGDCRASSLGDLAYLIDELILEIIEYLDPKDLLNLSSTSKVLYCFATFDELWKQFTIERFGGDWIWEGTWKHTFLKTSSLFKENIGKNKITSKPTTTTVHLNNFFSDVLFQPFLCSSIELDQQYLGNETIDRRSNLTMDEFINEYAIPNKPVIITDIVTNWPAFKKWSLEYLVENFGDVKFRAEAIDIKLKNYIQYAKNTMDESPLYLFDKNFGDTSRSGSTFHKDPNSTSAWNAVIKGSKKWIMYPPDSLPPGVFTSAAEVTSPISLMEWYLNFYKMALKSKPRPLEGICKAGEIIFVPNGWWHSVLNLDDSIAITQNFVGTYNLKNVLKFLHDKPDQVSGFSKSIWSSSLEQVYDIFYEKLKKYYPNQLSLSSIITNNGKRIKDDDDDKEKTLNSNSSLWSQLTKNNQKANLSILELPIQYPELMLIRRSIPNISPKEEENEDKRDEIVLSLQEQIVQLQKELIEPKANKENLSKLEYNNKILL
ncbi:8519_t:CDS:2 [Entrophospora sp. SA101]|nr:8519_t:CDS:2 [Entrophospora sp. SA101]CAJ0842930.1 4403_t:CDS:2 [Entrophospora sp. SA101]